MRHEYLDIAPDGITLDQKVSFLSDASAYRHAPTEILRRETHMSWVFLAGDLVFKLKKPVRFPYLDFSSIGQRETACRAELVLNRRLAADVYLGVAALTVTSHGLSIGGEGAVADWLVVMRRLDERQTLEHAILSGRVERWQLDRLAATLVHFYRTAARPYLSADRHFADWCGRLCFNRRILLDDRLGLPAGLVRHVSSVQQEFLRHRKDVLSNRVASRNIVDGHGDLRPEHIWLGDQVRIIDCLEFNRRLRTVDPLDETAFLSLECDRLGAPWVGEYIKRRVFSGLRDTVPDALFLFYRCYRATVRARLAIAHLMEPAPRTPEKWPCMARTYLRIASADATRLKWMLRTPSSRRAIDSIQVA